MSIRDRIQRLEERGPEVDEAAVAEEKKRTQEFLSRLPDGELLALEEFYLKANADHDGPEAKAGLACTNLDDLMDVVRKWKAGA